MTTTTWEAVEGRGGELPSSRIVRREERGVLAAVAVGQQEDGRFLMSSRYSGAHKLNATLGTLSCAGLGWGPTSGRG